MLAHTSRPGPPGGDRPLLVLLHAFPLDSSTWRRLLPLAARRGPVVALDLPGLGGSPAPGPDAGPPSLDLAADLVADTVRRLTDTPVVLHGVSTGGYTALALAARHPDLVAGLALSSTDTRVGPPDVPDDRRATAATVAASRSTAAVASSADEALGPTARLTQPHLRDELAATIARADPDGVAWIARAVAARHDTTAVLAALDRPVLLLAGAEDEATPPGRARAMAAVRERAGRGDLTRLRVLPETGHLTALERPGLVDAHLSALVAWAAATR